MKQRLKPGIIALALACVLLPVHELSAQDIEINGFTGWLLGGRANLYDGEFRIDDAMNYGGKIAVGLSTSTFMEISYMRTDTRGIFYPYSIAESPSVPIDFSGNYIQIGSLQQANLSERIAPFGTIAVGMTVWDPKSSQLSAKAQFSVTVGAGLKLWITDILGIRLQGSMLMPMVLNGVGFGCGIGTGGTNCGTNVYTRITPFQGEFSGGLIIRLSPN